MTAEVVFFFYVYIIFLTEIKCFVWLLKMNEIIPERTPISMVLIHVKCTSEKWFKQT